MGKKLTTEEFVKKSNEIHLGKYDYSKVVYINSDTKVIVTCTKNGHGDFKQNTSKHLSGQGCSKCGHESSNNNLKSTTDEFVIKAKKIHLGKYDYSKINYINAITKVVIICPIHFEFTQTPNAHLSGKGCNKCCVSRKSTLEEFVEKAKKVHKNKYNYLEYSDCKTEIRIICKIHGIFLQTPDHHLNQKCGCPYCFESKGEVQIKNLLINNNIKFIQQKKFENCINKRMLPFDFYLPDYNLCIEYDGRQHFEPIEIWGGEKSFKLTQLNDQIKTEYCKNNNIKLLRITCGV